MTILGDRTAEAADQWVPIRPGSDALLLAAMVTTLADDGAVDPGPHVAPFVRGLDAVIAARVVDLPDPVGPVTRIMPRGLWINSSTRVWDRPI